MIMAVDDVERRRGVCKTLHNGSLKKNPAVCLVPVILSCRSIEVDSRTIEETIVADQEDINGRARQLAAVHIVRKRVEADPDPAVTWHWNMFEAELVKINAAMPRNRDCNRDA